MSLLKQFEKETGIQIKDLNEDKLIKIMMDSSYEHFFKSHNKAVELFDDILLYINDDEFKKELFTVRHSFNLLNVEKLLQNLFNSIKNEEITDEEFQNKILQIFESSDPIYVISTLICLLISKYKLDVSNYFEIFKNNVSKIKEIFNTIGRIENSYRFRTEVIDFLYTAQQEFFFEYEKDILENSDWIEFEIDKLTEFEETFKEEVFESIDIPPEALGLIDITKLPKD